MRRKLDSDEVTAPDRARVVASIDKAKPPAPCVTDTDAFGVGLSRVYCVTDLGRAD